ncbi:hypothetical protein DFJ73DRAFT_766851 [Zopfochytrium polystomum]|nr:hypothetical protein DFJ73DRAFT_766851 [Zopfochytrium polystomum]
MDTSAAATAGSALGEPPSAVVDHSYLSSTGLREAIGPITAIVHDDTGMNSTVHLVTTQKGEYAIKAPKNVYAAGALHRERLVLQALTGLDGKHLNTPEHVAVVQCEGANDDEDRGGKRSAHVLSRLPGINGARLWKREDVSREDRVALAAAIGRTLRRIHDGWKPSVAPMRCGKDAAEPSPPVQSVFDARSRGWLRTSLDTFYSPRIARRLAALTDEEKEEGEDARRLLAEIRTVADTPASDKIRTDPPFWNDLLLVHGDAMVPNFLFEKDTDGEQGWSLCIGPSRSESAKRANPARKNSSASVIAAAKNWPSTAESSKGWSSDSEMETLACEDISERNSTALGSSVNGIAGAGESRFSEFFDVERKGLFELGGECDRDRRTTRWGRKRCWLDIVKRTQLFAVAGTRKVRHARLAKETEEFCAGSGLGRDGLVVRVDTRVGEVDGVVGVWRCWAIFVGVAAQIDVKIAARAANIQRGGTALDCAEMQLSDLDRGFSCHRRVQPAEAERVGEDVPVAKARV